MNFPVSMESLPSAKSFYNTVLPKLRVYFQVLFMFLFMLISQSVIAQSGNSLSGTVKNRNNTPIEGVTIRVNDQSVLTDIYGVFKVEHLRDKNLEIIAEKQSWKP